MLPKMKDALYQSDTSKKRSTGSGYQMLTPMKNRLVFKLFPFRKIIRFSNTHNQQIQICLDFKSERNECTTQLIVFTVFIRLNDNALNFSEIKKRR